MNIPTGSSRQTFVVPVTGATYAPETLALTSPDRINSVTVLVESLPAASALELDLLRPGGNPATPGDWILAVKSWSAVGLQDPVYLSNWYRVRVRAKSGGTSGSAVVSASWD